MTLVKQQNKAKNQAFFIEIIPYLWANLLALLSYFKPLQFEAGV